MMNEPSIMPAFGMFLPQHIHICLTNQILASMI